MVARFRMPSFIVTLAVGTIVGGATFWLSNGATLFSGIPVAFRDLGRGALGGIPVLTLWALAMAALTVFVLDHTELGRRIPSPHPEVFLDRAPNLREVGRMLFGPPGSTRLSDHPGYLSTIRVQPAAPVDGVEAAG